MAQKNVVVIGAGVAGLTTAYLLSKDARHKIIVAAKHMPGDYDIEYASPWAGANYMPVSLRDSPSAQYDKDTWAPLADLAQNHPEAGVHFQECQIFNRSKDQSIASTTRKWLSELLSPTPWFASVVPNFRKLPTSDLPSGISSATSFTSVCINTAIYLPWLVSQCLANGVIFQRAIIVHISDAASLFSSTSHADLIINCTGLGASTLGGVQDTTVVPARGQIVLVRNATKSRMLTFSGTDDGDDESCYIMTRAAGGGTVLGGCYQTGSWDSQPDPNLAIRIMKRAVEACPELTGGKGMVEALDVVRHGVGLRPAREGGTRVEKELVGGVWVVHNYGAGGAGYQSSYGCAKKALELVEEALVERAKL